MRAPLKIYLLDPFLTRVFFAIICCLFWLIPVVSLKAQFLKFQVFYYLVAFAKSLINCDEQLAFFQWCAHLLRKKAGEDF